MERSVEFHGEHGGVGGAAETGNGIFVFARPYTLAWSFGHGALHRHLDRGALLAHEEGSFRRFNRVTQLYDSTVQRQWRIDCGAR
jgi:hypothetical protein